MGSAVDSVRRLPRNVKSRLRVVGGRSMKPAKDFDTQTNDEVWSDIIASESLDQPSSAIFDAASELKVIAAERLRIARIRAQYYADEYPLQTLLTLAGFAFVAGCVLRLWRANRD